MSGDGCILTGDAAGLVKPVSGGGLYPTFKTVPILADVLSEALAADDLSARRLNRYDRECMKAVGRELRHGYSLRKRLVRMDDEDICYAAELSRRDSIACHLKDIDLDFPSGVIKEIIKDPRNIPPILRMAMRFRP
jgi:flavin-dependent dehydrogenase